MKRIKNIFALIGTIFTCLLLTVSISAGSSTLLVNEVLIDPPNPSAVSDRCQYVELRERRAQPCRQNLFYFDQQRRRKFRFSERTVNISGQVVGATARLL